MILKRPYAFLVKHFRIIHALLLFCSIYLTYKTWSFVGFFSSYIRNGQKVTGVDDLSAKITSLMNILPLIVILLCGIIIYLLHYKKKPIMLYIYIAVTYGVLFLLYRYLDSFMYTIAFETPSIRFVNIIRDVCRVFSLVQVPVIAFAFVRTLGFDVKKFDFKRDLLDLGVDDADNEEYEFEFKLDSEDIKSRVKKRLRLFKYFYKENRFIFIGIRIVVIAIVAFFAYKIFSSYEKIYAENDSVDMGSYRVKVLETYKTSKDASGLEFNNKYFYVVTKMEYVNKTNTIITPGILYISYGENGLTKFTTKMNSKLNEFGVTYYNQTINPGETKVFTYIFEVPIEYYKEELMLRHLYNVEYRNNELQFEYKKVRLSPKEFDDETKNIDTKNLNEELTLKGSTLGESKVKIEQISINDSFLYNIVKCSNGSCNKIVNSIKAPNNEKFDMTLMRLKLNINFDESVLGKNYTNDKFIQEFGSIRFEINGKEYNNRLKLVDMTPYVTNEYVYIQVRDKLKSADKIYLDLTIRDKIYTIIIKDTPKEENEK